MRSCQYWALYFPLLLGASREQTHCPLHWLCYGRLANDLILCTYSFLHCQSVKSFLKGSMSSVLHEQPPFWWLHLQLDLSERVSSYPLAFSAWLSLWVCETYYWLWPGSQGPALGGCRLHRGISADIVQALRSLPASFTEPLFPPSPAQAVSWHAAFCRREDQPPNSASPDVAPCRGQADCHSNACLSLLPPLCHLKSVHLLTKHQTAYYEGVKSRENHSTFLHWDTV